MGLPTAAKRLRASDRRTQRSRTGPSGWALAVTAVALVGLPATALGALVWAVPDDLAGVQPAAAPVVVAATEEALTDEFGVGVSLSWSPPEELRAPGWTGLVTAVHVGIGAVIGDGYAVAEIDGVARQAARSDAPFHRALRSGDRGLDVLHLERFLAARGVFTQVPDDRFDRATSLAVQEWKQSLGAVRPDAVFEPALVVWLPRDEFVVSRVDLSVGQPAPGLGQPVVAGTRTLGAARIAEAGADGPALRLPEVDVAWEMSIGELTVPLDSDARSVPGDALAGLAGTLPAGQEDVEGRVRRREPLIGVLLPIPAVVTAVDGATCVYLVQGAVYAPAPVDVRTTVGSAVAVEGLAAGDRVVVNPGDVLPTPACR